MVAGTPVGHVVAVTFDRAGITGEVVLDRVEDKVRGEKVWLFSVQTVSSARFWHRVLVKGEKAKGAEPVNPGLGPVPSEVLRGTPRETMAGFFDAWHAGRFDLAAFYLDLGAIPAEQQSAEGARLARRLNLALQRTLWVDLDTVSNLPLGAPEAGIPENEERLGTVQLGRREVELRLSHRWDPELGHVWLVSQPTVGLIDRLYKAHGYGWPGDHAPVVLFSVSFGGLQLWQWAALLVAMGVGWFLSRLLGHLAGTPGRPPHGSDGRDLGRRRGEGDGRAHGPGAVVPGAGGRLAVGGAFAQPSSRWCSRSASCLGSLASAGWP